jgi:hypothetical protein
MDSTTINYTYGSAWIYLSVNTEFFKKQEKK